jgi:uncharacterized protein (DUF1800 family)
VNRRDLLKAGAVAGGAAAIAGCDSSRAWNLLARQLEGRPETVELPADPTIDLATHVLNRCGFGPRPGDREAVRAAGVDAWIERQLDPASIDDTACAVRARRFETLHASAGDMFEFKRHVVEQELQRVTILRATYSRRQLFEAMVHFWTDHFNIAIGKAECAWLKTVDDRDVVRRHALGRFRDLLRASALSPAMLVYLDGDGNRRREGGEAPNENYARELLELHTLGVRGGYTQQDVMEAARCLTGWRVQRGWGRGRVAFEPGVHDDGAKKVLGVEIPARQGERDLDLLLDIVARHPSTARHLAWKLARRFVADDPPKELVERVAGAFRASEGAIAPVLRALFSSEAFRDSRGTRLKRPFHYVVSALRALDADTDGGRGVQEWLERMGQPPFHHPTPDGYPEEPAPWLGTLLWRWNFAVAVATGRVAGTRAAVDDLVVRANGRAGLAAHVLGRAASTAEFDAIREMPSDAMAAALVVASPGFQRF